MRSIGIGVKASGSVVAKDDSGATLVSVSFEVEATK